MLDQDSRNMGELTICDMFNQGEKTAQQEKKSADPQNSGSLDDKVQVQQEVLENCAQSAHSK